MMINTIGRSQDAAVAYRSGDECLGCIWQLLVVNVMRAVGNL